MIYLIDFQTCYKIGRTSDLRKRLRQFKNTRENFQCLDLIIDHILSKEELSDVITKIFRSKRSKINSKLNQYDMNGNFIKSQNTLSQASRELDISVSSISLCCSGKYKKLEDTSGKQSKKKNGSLTELLLAPILILLFQLEFIFSFLVISYYYTKFTKT